MRMFNERRIWIPAAVLSLLFVFLVRENIAQTGNVNLSGLAGFDGEPSLAVNPKNPDNIIAGWMRLRLDGRIWIATRTSFDGGRSWGAIHFQPHEFSDYGSADVSLVFHRSGRAYLSFVDFRTSPDTSGAVFLSTSTDGGSNWEAPRKVIDLSERPDLPVDRPWIAIDNSAGPYDGTVYVTTMSAFWYPGQHHTYVRGTGDNGKSWSPIRQVDNSAFSVGSLTLSYGAVSVGGDGKLYIAYLSHDTVASPFLRYYTAVSNDAGATFQRHVVRNVFLTAVPSFTIGWSVAADPSRNGHAVLCWIDQRFGDLDVVLSRTNDGGETWSVPQRINDDPEGAGIVQGLVWADYSPTGALGIAWRDRRLGGVGADVPFDIFGTISEDGADSFTPNFRISDLSSPYSRTSCCNSFLGVAMSDDFINSVWGDFRNTNWDIYYGQVAVGQAVSVEQRDAHLPAEFSLSQNYPNPFNPETRIRYALLRQSRVKLEIFNLAGQLVARLADAIQPAGAHLVVWDGRDGSGRQVSSGIYFYRLQAGESARQRKMLLLR